MSRVRSIGHSRGASAIRKIRSSRDFRTSWPRPRVCCARTLNDDAGRVIDSLASDGGTVRSRLAAVVVALLAVPILAQTPRTNEQIQVALVEVPVNVVDRNGDPIR